MSFGLEDALALRCWLIMWKLIGQAAATSLRAPRTMGDLLACEERLRAGLDRLNEFISTWEGDPAPPETESKHLLAGAYAALDEMVVAIRERL